MKALVLLSGGLDSRLACKIMQEQGEVTGVFFKLPFIKDVSEDLKKFCDKEKIHFMLVDYTSEKFDEYINMIKNAKYSRGKALNPCIDCHLFIFKKAREIAEKEKFDVLVSGEVLGERPLSQTKKAFAKIDSEIEILRPLSAKLLPETQAEKKGIVDRNKFYDFLGRKRKKQLELAKRYNIDFPMPAGGCLLCEKKFCEKLEKVWNNKFNIEDVKLLSVGRHFESSQIIIGKNNDENEELIKNKGIKVIPTTPGAVALVRSSDKTMVEKAKILIKKYSKAVNDFKVLE